MFTITSTTEPTRLEDEIRQEEQEFLSWLETFQPLVGSDGEDGDDGEGGESYDDIDDDEDDEDVDQSGSEDGDDEDDDSADHGVEQLRQQLAAEQERRIKAEQATRKAKAAERTRRQSEAQASGDLEAIRREFEAEKAELQEELDAARETATVNEYTLDQERRTNRVNRLAQSLGFRDPGDAIALLTEDETGDEKSTLRALNALSKKKPYLIDRKKSGRAMGGGRNGLGLTMEDIKKMSADEINANWDEAQKVMQQSGQSI
jgi:hypothetical protein